MQCIQCVGVEIAPRSLPEPATWKNLRNPKDTTSKGEVAIFHETTAKKHNKTIHECSIEASLSNSFRCSMPTSKDR